MKKLSLVVALLFVSYALIFAQDQTEKLPYNRWEIGINAGVANSVGATSFSKDMMLKRVNEYNNDMGFGYGFFVKKNFTHVFALEGAYNGTTITGSPMAGYTKTYAGNTYKAYETGINEMALNTVWNMNNLFSSNKFDRKVYWYMKLGAGVTHVKNTTFSDPTQMMPWRYWTVPIGTGLAFRLTDKVKLDIGTQWSWVNSNRLDGVNQGSADPQPKGPGYLIAQLRDQYLYTHAGLTFVLGKKPEKPAPIVEAPKPQPKPEPKPEPKPVPPPAPKHVTPACVGQIFKVFFAFDKWDLNANAKTELDRLAKDMQDNPEVKLEMKSHTDSRGPASYNMKLSEKRGKSVLDYLTAKGISASRINAQAFGESQLTNKCSDGVKCTEAEHQANRRTETLVIE